MSLLLAGVAATGLVISMNSPAAGVALRTPSPLMQLKRVPGEGDPFGEKEGLARGNRLAPNPAFQPRGISDATVIKPQYIETEDEPW